MPSSADAPAPRTVAYVSSAGTREVIALGVDAPLPEAMAYIATDRTGRFLFGASYLGAKLSVNSIGPDGEVEAPARQVLATPPKAHSILADLTNRWVFAISLEDDAVLQFSFDAERGILLPNSPAFVRTRPNSGPRHLVLHPNGRFLYVNNELDGCVVAFSLDTQRGSLAALQTVATLQLGGRESALGADMHITPDGRFLYTSERTTSSLAAFAIDGASGRLSLTGTYPTQSSPRGFNISPCGRWLLAAGQKTGRSSLYSIDDRDGSLARIAELPTGSNPNWVEFASLR